ncbi:hypothetical protein DUI87_03450 [Hirundo rustica rustica]|uniref:Heparan-sulfate 6-O-sulfotransferase n=1 Tax=Hirundo rustica rustica TaxID=333673 RepID=A0A3M0L7C9_HIRRU|nr:hypothetical protein DUI87_03450 [Hirundo rustica rustica]
MGGSKNWKKAAIKMDEITAGVHGVSKLIWTSFRKILQAFSTPPRIQIIQYVDDLLLSGEDEVEVREATIRHLNFLGEKGLRVSKGKLQFVEPEVKYPGHLISKGSQRLSPERIAGILSLPPPSSKREIRKLLGLLGYCRLWIEGYTQAVKFLYEKLTEGDNIKWTKEDDDKLEKLKLKLASIPALSLPSLENPFHLYVNVEKGIAHGVLVQEWGGVKRPVAYLSEMLDPVSHGWPVCIQAIAATAILVEESHKLTFGGKLIVCTPHAVRNVLNQKAEKWLTDSRMLKYEAILIDSDDLTLEVNRSLNPAQFLYGEPADNLIHNCLEIIQYQTKVRGDLEEQALSEGEIIYVDGSSRCLQGKRMSGYAAVDGKNMQTIEKGKLPSIWSAQTCELYALKKALEYLAHKKGTIYTDSRNFYYITILRDPVSRYLSEWRHVQRGATWKASLHVCDGRSPTTEELPSCYTGDDWSGCSLQEFMDCPYNLANNRQVRMLSDLSLVGCYNLSVMPEEQRNKILLDSAKENLKRMAFFGLTEFQRKTQYLFEKTFNMNFISPFTQYNSTRASSMEIDKQTQQHIKALNFLDMKLYDYAKDLFLQRYQYMRQKEHQEARRKRQEQRKILRVKQTHLREQGENSSSTDYTGNVERWR